MVTHQEMTWRARKTPCYRREEFHWRTEKDGLRLAVIDNLSTRRTWWFRTSLVLKHSVIVTWGLHCFTVLQSHGKRLTLITLNKQNKLFLFLCLCLCLYLLKGSISVVYTVNIWWGFVYTCNKTVKLDIFCHLLCLELLIKSPKM